MSDRIVFWEAPDRGYYCSFKYNADFIGALKENIPHYYREWLPALKFWWIDRLFYPTALRLARRYFTQVIAKDDYSEPAAPPPPPPPANPYGALYLLPTAPQPVVRAVYKVLAKLHHPDVGGDPELMKTINLAYEAIEEGGL